MELEDLPVRVEHNRGAAVSTAGRLIGPSAPTIGLSLHVGVVQAEYEGGGDVLVAHFVDAADC